MTPIDARKNFCELLAQVIREWRRSHHDKSDDFLDFQVLLHDRIFAKQDDLQDARIRKKVLSALFSSGQVGQIWTLTCGGTSQRIEILYLMMDCSIGSNLKR